MATQTLSRSLISKPKALNSSFFLSSSAAVNGSSTKTLIAQSPLPSVSFLRLLGAPPCVSCRHNHDSSSPAIISFSTHATKATLNDPKAKHWRFVMEPPPESATRDAVIDSYTKTLAQVVGSEEEARMRIYSVTTTDKYTFGALVSEEDSHKIKELPGVRSVLPDSYMDVKNKDCGEKRFTDKQAIPYEGLGLGAFPGKIRLVISQFSGKEVPFEELGLRGYTGKVGMPKSRSLYTVLRSPHIDKKSREQFSVEIKKQVMETKAHDLHKKMFWLKRMRIFGAQFSIQLSYKTRLDALLCKK